MHRGMKSALCDADIRIFSKKLKFFVKLTSKTRFLLLSHIIFGMFAALKRGESGHYRAVISTNEEG